MVALDAPWGTHSKVMPEQTREVGLGPNPQTVRTKTGQVMHVPNGWVLVPPGDPGLTRRLKSAGPTWTVKEKRGRRMFSQGVWVNGATVEAIRRQLETERANPAYQRKLDAAKRKREEAQEKYAEEFQAAVEAFLNFAAPHAALGKGISHVITEQTIAVGSGTVARTARIELPQKAEAATIAWLRHQTTEYDDMKIPRIKGMRREVRRMLAERSRKFLGTYRRGEAVDLACCPLTRALLP